MFGKLRVRVLLLEVILVAASAERASSFHVTPPASRIIASKNNNQMQPHLSTCSSKNKPPSTSPLSFARRTALNLSGGAVVAGEVVKDVAIATSFLGAISSFYMTYPVISAIGTCSLKGFFADLIAQRAQQRDAQTGEDGEKSKEAPPAFCYRRNMAYVVYGGLFLGLMCEVVYNRVYPLLFGGLTGTSRIAATVAFDSFVSAPCLWLPPIYFVKAILYGHTFKEGFQKYINDVRHKGLLTAYWKVWIPAQLLNFGKVPAHLRVAFMAGCSFFWMIILSCLSSNKEKAAA